MNSEAFRANVGLVLLKDEKVFIFERIDIADAWQLPQGGIDVGETPIEAAYRELAEETGLRRSDVRFVAEYPDWLVYEFPDHVKKGAFLGQAQKWFFFELVNDESAINLTAFEHQEFSRFRRISHYELEEIAVSFRKPIYRKLSEFLTNYER